jgi:molybdopterin converting factor small subunit
MVLVNIPASLRQFSSGDRQIRLDCADRATLEQIFEQLRGVAPGVVERALDEQGRIRPHVNVFVNGQSIRASMRSGLQTPVAAGAEVWILPAVSGGQAIDQTARGSSE